MRYTRAASPRARPLSPWFRHWPTVSGSASPLSSQTQAFLSKDNTEALVKDGYQYILGARPKNESEKVKESILALNLKYGDVAEVKRKDGSRLVVSCSEKRAAKDRHNREKGLARLQKRVRTGKLTKESINNRGYNKYLKPEGEVNVSIDLAKYEADAAWDGIKGYVTNTKLKADEVIDRYGDLLVYRTGIPIQQIRPGRQANLPQAA